MTMNLSTKTNREHSAMKIHSKKTKALTFTFAILIFTMLLSSNYVGLAAATKITSCSTASGPKGVTMDSTSSNIWIGEATAGKLGTSAVSSSPTSCSVTSYTGQHDPTRVAFSGGGGSFAFTQKGTGGSTTSCITTFNTATDGLSNSQCSNGAGFDDVAQDPTSTTVVWTSLYYVGKIASYDTSSGTITYVNVPKAGSCSVTPEPEGLRVDSSGNVWVADEACNAIDEYQPSSGGFWSTYLPGYTPAFLDLDNTNNYVWATAPPYNLILKMTTSGTTTTVSDTSSETTPLVIAVDPANNRVDVTFQNAGSGSIDEYNTGSNPGWLCGSGAGDVYTSSYPYGITTESSNYYWATDYNNAKLLVGDC